MRRSTLRFLLGALALSACSEPNVPACATQIAEDVCSTPAQLRGAEPVSASASGVAIALPPSPLAEGRYVLASRSTSCAPGAAESLPASVQGVLEVRGCVLRRTLVSEPEPARVEVFELGYADDEGVLALQRRCPEEEAGALRASYGSDGVSIELGRLQASDESTEVPDCDTLDTWELR
ncbi:MAG: hypothetical protein RL685_1856 [Pseudomonadota bacterium]|jgi:hypothetical protein